MDHVAHRILVVDGVNVELTKNASEVGYARFLYAVRR